MKKRNQISPKGFILRMIPVVLTAVLFSISFHSCQEDESIARIDPESPEFQTDNLKSATISVTAIDVLIATIEDYVINGELKSGIANALISKLENAKKSLEKGNEKPAINQLQAVVSQLESLVGNGTIDSEVGEEIIFDTRVIAGENPTFIDTRDSREYKTIKIGEQIWMAENLAFDAGDGCWVYDNYESNIAIYGRLYDWATVMDGATSSIANPSGVQGICPTDWHVPSDAEWTQLKDYLSANGFPGTEGTALKATSGWGNDGNGTDDYGFSALPGGFRYGNGTFFNIGYSAHWWSASEESPSYAWRRYLDYSISYLDLSANPKGFGFSVRCVRD